MVTFHTETVDVLAAPSVTDRYGNQVLDWDTATVTTVQRCRVLPVAGVQVLDRETRRWILFAPPGTALISANRVRWGGADYDVVDVRRWPSPSGAVAHIEADLERVEG